MRVSFLISVHRQVVRLQRQESYPQDCCTAVLLFAPVGPVGPGLAIRDCTLSACCQALCMRRMNHDGNKQQLDTLKCTNKIFGTWKSIVILKHNKLCKIEMQ